ncbi:glycosyltransferase family 2 protein [Gilvimarinus agarilyticus]|uniref:glycosyltransferase family 2 protein n=1 Tax=Gilvimarinus sp. 2_MG-2023 TaxID=3062666 RepID=UPI001C08481A|nr:glycosyltransferase family 2 protein [Gilvimarinus sp. 2_MG-2023]MBU2887570.1 glycosyltransferase family 2 protein [Gilvimarinus agarilyticus]MDO6572221.1 glycosyltransferase family 2 protein [Gilvimarinus sp. 2_MG-2023]
MATCNGANFLREQLDSIGAQTHKNWCLWVSDDNSTDATPTLLKEYQGKFVDRVRIVPGPARGVAENFLSLVYQSGLDADYFSYCDQDDIWLENKIERALEQLASVDSSIPAVYFSRTLLVTEDNKPICESGVHAFPPGFCNALVQNIGPGNTMVFNRAARELLCEARISQTVYHDWWTYMLVTGAGGEVIYDDEAVLVRYRQHQRNVIGTGVGWMARARRAVQLIAGDYKSWNDINVRSLESSRSLLNGPNQAAFDNFCRARRDVFKSVFYLRKSGVYRQTLLENIALYFSAIFQRL